MLKIQSYRLTDLGKPNRKVAVYFCFLAMNSERLLFWSPFVWSLLSPFMWHPQKYAKSWLLFAIDYMPSKSTKVYRNQISPLTSFPLVWRSSQMWCKQHLCVVLPSQAQAKGSLQMQTFWRSLRSHTVVLLWVFTVSQRRVESLSSWNCQKLVPWVLSLSWSRYLNWGVDVNNEKSRLRGINSMFFLSFL